MHKSMRCSSPSFDRDAHIIRSGVCGKNIFDTVVSIRPVKDFNRHAFCIIKLKRRIKRHDECNCGFCNFSFFGRFKADHHVGYSVSILIAYCFVIRIVEKNRADMRSLVFGDNTAQRFTVGGNELSAVLGEAVFKQLAATLRNSSGAQDKLTVLAKGSKLFELGVK